MSNELGEFLRARRARIAPESVGLPRGARRRVPGLRRDELARLAGVSVEYYTRLEQGRSPNVSDSVLDAIGSVLSLNETELEHLRTLVRPTRRARPSPRGASKATKVRPTVQAMLDQLDRLPAVVLGPALDVLAWNRLADAMYDFTGKDDTNMARHVFRDPDAAVYYPEWDRVARETVANLRLMAARHPDNPRLESVIGELAMHSQQFRELWAHHDVMEKSFGHKAVGHPLVGRMDLGYETFPLTGEQDMILVIYMPEPGSASAEKLALLASWSVPELEGQLAERGVPGLTPDGAEG
ncbi:helix-turn-helix transcriptional regulator [Actinocrispum wychmicini]|uniref:Transcriptional regulator with XRE-family HTH domain n=1 Tax=Actinocrispum wychmicini TaxID=1213861 RepID=A0A4V2S8Z4_9PSEU|nr:helix-turn-helix transcriptional regulator [Actinocrispum wychmicini]TCO65670.1 transcriptional regulator with XRE-family HTH domain [Actinocrispum wychmicini]